MADDLTDVAIDKSTFVVTCAFTDEDGDAVVPTSIKWTLTDNVGTVINSRSNINVAAPASSINIVLSGRDLKYSDGPIRILTVQAVYTSSLGAGLPLNDSVQFHIENLVAV